MRLHEKIADIRDKKGFTQKQMAKTLHMSREGYGKIERGERRLISPRLEKIATVLGIEVKDLFSLDSDDKMVFNATFHHVESCQNQNYYVDSAKELIHELETSRLVIEQQQREIELLREQVG